MIAAIIAIVTFYLAIRFTLSEIFRKLKNIKEAWMKKIRGETETAVLKFQSLPGSAEPSSPKKGPEVLNMISEINTQKRLPSANILPRRRTGAVNSKPTFRQRKAKGFSRNRLRLPFMDSGNWLQGQIRNGYSSSYLSQNSSLRPLLPDEYNANAWVKHTNSALSNTSTNESTVNMFKVPTENRNSNIFSRFFHHAYVILQRDSSINYPDVSEKVMASERVKTAIKSAVMEDFKGKIPDDSQLVISHLTHKRRALLVLQNMRSCISSFLLKIAAWVMYKLLGRMLDGIEIRKEQIDTLRRASQNDVPIVYLPLHRSHLDYILVTFILYMNDLRAPLVAAGNNLMIPFFGALLRGLGAFFIKRKLDPKKGKRDFVYRAILHTYMEESLKEGHSLEFFIEGGRSRTGKAVLPKAGLLSIVVDTLISGGISDAYIVPIAMSYEKLLDGNFVSEQMGKPKVMESFSTAVKGIWRTLHSNFGTVRVDFCQPFSLKEFLLAAEYSYNSPMKNLQSCSLRQNRVFNHNVKARRRSEYGSEVVLEDHRQVIKDLADYVVYDAFNANALMSTNLVSFLFATKHRKGTTLHQLVSSMNWLREEVGKRNKIMNFTGESLDLVKRACTLLGRGLVNSETIQMMWSSGATDSNNMKITFYKPAVNLPDILELQYYANAVLPVFLLESVVVIAFYAVCSEESIRLVNKDKKPSVHRAHVIKQALELCSVLQYEFIFAPPGTSLCSVLNATVDDLIYNGLIEVCDDSSNETWDSTSPSTPLITDFQDDNNYIIEEENEEMEQRIKMTSSEDHASMLQFLRCVLSPFIESYWLVTCSLPKLISSEIDEVNLLQEIKRLGQKKLNLGQIYYEESLGLDTLKNSLKLFESWKILKSKSVNSRNIICLHPSYNAESPLKEMISRIEKYKK